MSWIKNLFGSRNGTPLSSFAEDLISPSDETSDAAIIRALSLAKQGEMEGLTALEEAIEFMYQGDAEVEFYTPGIRLLREFALADDAPHELLLLAKQQSLWTTQISRVQELVSQCQVAGIEVRTLIDTAVESNCDRRQIKALQLLSLHLAARVALSNSNPEKLSEHVQKYHTAISSTKPEAESKPEKKIPCERCGAMILPSTARRCGGLCMPCALGRR